MAAAKSRDPVLISLHIICVRLYYSTNNQPFRKWSLCLFVCVLVVVIIIKPAFDGFDIVVIVLYRACASVRLDVARLDVTS